MCAANNTVNWVDENGIPVRCKGCNEGLGDKNDPYQFHSLCRKCYFVEHLTLMEAEIIRPETVKELAEPYQGTWNTYDNSDVHYG